ncbi:hypothetical protein HDV00_012143, partial [Rhizophlyctis rosea]
ASNPPHWRQERWRQPIRAPTPPLGKKLEKVLFRFLGKRGEGHQSEGPAGGFGE